MNYTSFILFFAFAITGTGSAQERHEIESLSIFKNGQSFVVKQAVAEAPNKFYRLEKLPNALFGTFWFSGISSKINSVTSKKEEAVEKQERKANSFLELLHANKGMEISVSTSDNKLYKGIVEDFDLPEEINSRIQLAQLQLTQNYEGLYNFDRIFSAAAPVLLLKLNGTWVGIEPSSIKSIEFGQKPKRTTTASITIQKPVITINFDNSGQQTFRYMYLQNGLSWTPVYQLQLLSETEARLSLQAEVTNNVEDIKNTAINFVVGAPNFSKATTLATLLKFDNQGAAYQNTAAYQFRNDFSVAERRASNADEAGVLSDITASEYEDLYFYTLKNISLDKGGRAQFPLFTNKIKINHFYRCDLPPSPFDNNYVLNSVTTTDVEMEKGPIEMETPLSVKHYIDIYNNSENPFTSGPVLMLAQGNGTNALAQDVLPFIPRGSQAPVLITSSPDIIVKEREGITHVKSKDKKKDGYDYALVTISGTIEVHNTKSKNIDIRLKKILAGKMLKANVKYNTIITNSNNGANNGKQEVSFTTSLKASEKATISYSYQTHFRE